MSYTTQTQTSLEAAGEGTGNEFLAFTLGREEYGIDILQVQEIRGYEPVTRIANAPDFIKGVVNLRGTIVPIVDMRIKFNLGTPTYDQFTVVIILNIAGRVVGMVVDSVSDVITLTPEQIKPAPGIRHGLRYRLYHRPGHARRAHADPGGHREADVQPRDGTDREDGGVNVRQKHYVQHTN